MPLGAESFVLSDGGALFAFGLLDSIGPALFGWTASKTLVVPSNFDIMSDLLLAYDIRFFTPAESSIQEWLSHVWVGLPFLDLEN